MWGVDNSLLSRAIEADVFEPYAAEGLNALPEELITLVPGNEATPVVFGDVCVNYDIAGLGAAGLKPPASLADLVQPEYFGTLVVQNPATSSTGLAFLLATIAEFGEDGWEDYWAELRANEVIVVDSWTRAYYGEFTWAGGDRPLVVSYGSSPAFEVLFTEEPLDEASTGVVESSCFRQVEFAGVLRGTDAPDATRRLVDFLISERFQREVALNLFVFPVNPDVELDPVFVDFAVIPEAPLSVDPHLIDASRTGWIDRWTAIVTRADDGAEFPLQQASEHYAAAQTKQYELRMELFGEKTQMSGGVDLQAQIMSQAATVEYADGTVEEMITILDAGNEIVYLDSDGLGGPSGVPWVSVDLDVFAAWGGVTAESLQDAFVPDPTDSFLSGVNVEDIVEVGTETIDGIDVRHYEVAAEPTDLLEAGPDLELLDLPDDAVPSVGEADIWITEDNKVLRVSFEMEMDLLGERFYMLVVIFGIGESLEFEIPAPKDVIDLTDEFRR